MKESLPVTISNTARFALRTQFICPTGKIMTAFTTITMLYFKKHVTIVVSFVKIVSFKQDMEEGGRGEGH